MMGPLVLVSNQSHDCHVMYYIDVNECAIEDFCSHGCHNKEGGFQCSCPVGLFISSDLRSCIGKARILLNIVIVFIGCSINNGGCSQLCVTGSDGYHCRCRSGFEIGSDGTTCYSIGSTYRFISLCNYIATVDSNLYFSLSIIGVGIVIESTLTNVVTDTVVSPSYQVGPSFMNNGEIYAMDINVADRLLYFNDRSSDILWQIPLESPFDGRRQLSDNVQAWGMVYDWINHYLYWTDDR